MSVSLDATHDPELRSWVESANDPSSDFPIQNLPFAIFRRAGSDEPFRAGVAIGDEILDLRAAGSRGAGSLGVASGGVGSRGAGSRGVVPESAADLWAACAEPSLNRLMSLGAAASSSLRAQLSGLLREGSAAGAVLREDLVPQSEAEFATPARIGDFTDFYSSIHHATPVGRQLRPDNPLLANYRWIPIAYHGRSSSIHVTEHAFHRPVGQVMPKGALRPELRPTQRLDFELEMGIFVGRGNPPGIAIPVKNAESHVFGLCLLNDWSARDVQGWEYQPLGPFLGKNFATTISPWIVTLEALAPFRVPFERPPEDPQPLEYLADPWVTARGGIDVALEVALQTVEMRDRGMPPERLALSNFRHAYWTIAQMIAHHSVNGCNLRPGDLLGSGTMSGPAPAQAGSLLELTAGGRQPLALASAETRRFLEDGDRVVLRAWCESPGRKRIGFGCAAGTVLPARPLFEP